MQIGCRTVLVRAALALVLVILVMLAACNPKTSSPGPLATGDSIQPSKTAKPTFTPRATRTKSTLTSVRTARPTLAAPGTSTPDQDASATPQAAQEPSPTPESPEPSPTTKPTLPPKKPLRMNSPEYGMQAFLWWRPEVASRDLQKIHEAGFTWCKVGFGWRDIEGAARGAFDWSHTDRIVEQANREGIDLVVRIDHQPAWAGGGFPTNGPPDNLRDYAKFLTALASRYRGRIRAYEVWHEPHLAREWGGKLPDPVAYVKMLKMAYAAIKAADPNAMVISAGLSPTGTWNEVSRPDDWYLESMYVAMGGSSNGYFDVLGVHGAGFKSPPERDPATVAADPALGGHRAFCFRRVEDLRAIMVKCGDANKQIALLEFGWTSDPRPGSPYNWHAVTEQQKAKYLVGAYQYAKAHWSPWIGLMSLIYISDPDWTEGDEQYWWAISYPSYPAFQPRPAYQALKAMSK